MMTSVQAVKTSVNVITNSPSQDYTHPDEHTLPTYSQTQRKMTEIPIPSIHPQFTLYISL